MTTRIPKTVINDSIIIITERINHGETKHKRTTRGKVVKMEFIRLVIKLNRLKKTSILKALQFLIIPWSTISAMLALYAQL